MKVNTAIQLRERTSDQKPRGHGDKLDRKTEAAIVALLAHPTMSEAAKSAGIGETTLWRWLQREDFRKQYRAAQDKALDGALGALQGAATRAIETLRRNLDCSNPGVQVQAARSILDYTFRVREQFDYAYRIGLLEEALRAREEADGLRGELEDE